jgi:hypothetical protein
MSVSPTPQPLPSTDAKILQRLSLGTNLMLLGSAIGIVAVFLKAFSAKFQSTLGDLGMVPDGKNELSVQGGFSRTLMVYETWEGIVACLGCLATAVAALALLSGRLSLNTKQISFVALLASAIALLLSITLLATLLINSDGSVDGPGFQLTQGPGAGAFLMILASGMCLAGSVLQAKPSRIQMKTNRTQR